MMIALLDRKHVRGLRESPGELAVHHLVSAIAAHGGLTKYNYTAKPADENNDDQWMVDIWMEAQELKSLVERFPDFSLKMIFKELFVRARELIDRQTFAEVSGLTLQGTGGNNLENCLAFLPNQFRGKLLMRLDGVVSRNNIRVPWIDTLTNQNSVEFASLSNEVMHDIAGMLVNISIDEFILECQIAYFQMEQDMVTVTAYLLVDAKYLWLNGRFSFMSSGNELQSAFNDRDNRIGLCIGDVTVKFGILSETVTEIAQIKTSIVEISGSMKAFHNEAYNLSRLNARKHSELYDYMKADLFQSILARTKLVNIGEALQYIEITNFLPRNGNLFVGFKVIFDAVYLSDMMANHKELIHGAFTKMFPTKVFGKIYNGFSTLKFNYIADLPIPYLKESTNGHEGERTVAALPRDRFAARRWYFPPTDIKKDALRIQGILNDSFVRHFEKIKRLSRSKHTLTDEIVKLLRNSPRFAIVSIKVATYTNADKTTHVNIYVWGERRAMRSCRHKLFHKYLQALNVSNQRKNISVFKSTEMFEVQSPKVNLPNWFFYPDRVLIQLAEIHFRLKSLINIHPMEQLHAVRHAALDKIINRQIRRNWLTGTIWSYRCIRLIPEPTVVLYIDFQSLKTNHPELTKPDNLLKEKWRHRLRERLLAYEPTFTGIILPVSNHQKRLLVSGTTNVVGCRNDISLAIRSQESLDLLHWQSLREIKKSLVQIAVEKGLNVTIVGDLINFEPYGSDFIGSFYLDIKSNLDADEMLLRNLMETQFTFKHLWNKCCWLRDAKIRTIPNNEVVTSSQTSAQNPKDQPGKPTEPFGYLLSAVKTVLRGNSSKNS